MRLAVAWLRESDRGGCLRAEGEALQGRPVQARSDMITMWTTQTRYGTGPLLTTAGHARSAAIRP